MAYIFAENAAEMIRLARAKEPMATFVDEIEQLAAVLDGAISRGVSTDVLSLDMHGHQFESWRKAAECLLSRMRDGFEDAWMEGRLLRAAQAADVLAMAHDQARLLQSEIRNKHADLIDELGLPAVDAADEETADENPAIDANGLPAVVQSVINVRSDDRPGREMPITRQVRAKLAFRVDQAAAALRSRLPELHAVRDRLIEAARAGELEQAVREISPYEAVAVLGALVHSSYAVRLSALEAPQDPGGETEDLDTA